MSIQIHAGAGSRASTSGRPERRGAATRSASDRLVATLAGGLRSTYRAEPDADMPDAFAALIARLNRAEDRAR